MAGLLKKIPFMHHEEEAKQPEEEGESLTTILATAEDRSALVNLLTECSETMRQSIVDIFDPKKTGQKSDIVADLTGDQALLNPEVDPGKVDVAEQDKAKKELEQREKELSGAKFKALKDAALKHFDEWFGNVIQRMGEVVNSREEPPQEKQEVKPDPAEGRISPEQTAPPIRFLEPSAYDQGVDKAINELYPPKETQLSKLPEDKKILILHSVFLLLLSLEHYHAESRIVLLHLTTSLKLSIKHLAHDESKVARGLLTAAENLKADDETKKHADENKAARRWKVGLATAAGAALIGVTGGLAAPLLAAGVGTVMGGLGLGATAAAGYLGTLAGSSVLIGGLFGAYGGRMSGKMMDQYAREVEDFGFVPIRSAHKPRKIEKEFRRLRVGIGVSGWLSNQEDVAEPWRVFGIELEGFALRWELEALMNLGNGLDTLMKSAAWSLAKREIIRHTVFAALSAGLWPLALVKVSRIIENPWSVASYRAQKAGEVLADALINKAQGERPVTLVGYSLGAKVVYTCLHRLAERKAFGLIESVVLIGAPTPSDSADWRMLRTVVSGRVVNVYSTQDYILAYLYRSSGIQYGVAGLQSIDNVKGVENVDVSDMVSGHTKYRLLIGPILQKIGFEDVDLEELEREKQALQEEEVREERERQENEKKETEKDSTSTSTAEVSDQHVEDLEKEVEKKNEQSYVGWAQQQMVSAGTSASVAYEKAKTQWFLRKQGAAGQTAGDAANTAGSAASTANQSSKKADFKPQAYEGT
jgi:pimeloyl-ACP methyl ester carboxylesterase